MLPVYRVRTEWGETCNWRTGHLSLSLSSARNGLIVQVYLMNFTWEKQKSEDQGRLNWTVPQQLTCYSCSWYRACEPPNEGAGVRRRASGRAVCALDCGVPSPAITQWSNPPHSLSPNSSPSPSLSRSTSCAGPPTGAASQWLFPWGNLTLPPQQPSVGGGGTSRDFPLSVLGFWLDLVEFMCAVALSCPANVQSP